MVEQEEPAIAEYPTVQCRIETRDGQQYDKWALNELVLRNASLSTLVTCVYINGDELETFRGDGLIVSSIDMVMMGYSCFQSKLQQKKKDRLEISFTDREQEIFELIVENLSNAEIAQQLYISEATVKTHVSSILRKTGQPNRSQAVLYALKKGLVKVPRK